MGTMPAACALDVCYGCMEKNKKSPRWGGEGWRPFVCVMPKSNGKQAPPLSFAITPTVTRYARPSPPTPLRKKSRFAKKSRLRRKKTRLPLTVGHRLYQGRYILTRWILCRDGASPRLFSLAAILHFFTTFCERWWGDRRH